MGFGGSVLAMIQSLRNNARPKHDAFQDWKKTEKRIFHSNQKLTSKSVTPEELFKIKSRIKKENETEQKRSFYLTIVSIVVLVPLIVFVVFQFFFNSSQKSFQAQQTKTETTENVSEQLNYLLNSGYEWLNKNHYKNARFQFKRVLEIQPDNKSANYGLLATYIYECKIDSTNCNEATLMFRNFVEKYGADGSTEYLKDILQE